MPKISLIATDLDGTLLNRTNTVSPKTQALLGEAKKRNVRIVLATTRNLYFVRYLCGLLDIADPVIIQSPYHPIIQ